MFLIVNPNKGTRIQYSVIEQLHILFSWQFKYLFLHDLIFPCFSSISFSTLTFFLETV